MIGNCWKSAFSTNSKMKSKGMKIVVALTGNLWVYFLFVVRVCFCFQANTEGLLWSRSKSFSCEPEEALINKFVCLPSDDIPHSQPSMSGSDIRALYLVEYSEKSLPFNKGTMFLYKYCCSVTDRAHFSALIVVTSPQGESRERVFVFNRTAAQVSFVFTSNRF